MLDDPWVQRLYYLRPLPLLSADLVEEMAKRLHSFFTDQNFHPSSDEVQQRWESAPEWTHVASVDQALWIPTLLDLNGFRLYAGDGERQVATFEVASAIGTGQVLFDPSNAAHAAAQELAEAEHARWCIEREKAGWHFGETRDSERKTHPDYVPWSELSEQSRRKDYVFIGFWPSLMGSVGMAIASK